jgi:hypothetical protein
MAIANNNQSEEQLQAQCYQWFHNSFPALRGLLFHIPNGGNRSMREGSKFKAIGVVPGIPDMLLCVPISNPESVNGKCHGLFIEMKAEKGKLSENQIKIHSKLEIAGYEVFVVNDFDVFKQKIISWLKYSHPSYL